MPSTFIKGAFDVLVVGIVATAVLDSWAQMLRRVFGIPGTNWAHVGRWVAGIPSGALRHDAIQAIPAVAHEVLLGWSTHYMIGVAYAAIYRVMLTATSQTPGPGSAILFGLVTVLAPWLILQPGLGAGYFAGNTPNPAVSRAMNVLSHSVFGVGLYLGFALIGFVG